MTDGLVLHRVTARLGRREVGPYDLRVAPGEVVALVGPNGAGKTTALHLLLGLRRRRGGEARVLGAAVDHREPPIGVGASLLDDGHLPWRSGLEQLALVADRRAGHPDPGEALELVGLGGAAHQPTGAYSAGMLRRLGLARALLGTASALVLDEPTASLDDRAGDWLAGVLRERAAGGAAVLLASHDPALLDALGPRLVVVDRCRTTGGLR